MLRKWFALLGVAALLAACSSAPVHTTAHEQWNGGVWNSMLGYHGPANATVVGGP